MSKFLGSSLLRFLRVRRIFQLLLGALICVGSAVLISAHVNDSATLEDTNFIRSAPLQGNAAKPLRSGQTTLYKKGQVLHNGGRPIGADLIAEWDVPIKTRSGTTVYADLFRPVGTAKAPVIVGWGPYGKENGEERLQGWPNHGNVPLNKTSGLQKFEAPDPAYWCAHGYAILNPDPAGVGHSTGNIRFFGTQDAADGYDVIEWAGTRSWSNGKVALAGNSWLAISQWFIAATRPPHLRAIAPWEGVSDLYADWFAWGGIPDFAFGQKLATTLMGEHYTESPADMIRREPLMTPYWQSKRAALRNINAPAYVVASWTNGLHVSGTFRGWREISSKQKWLRIHNTHEWPDLYEYEDDLRAFYDHFLFGQDNEWERTPRVRYSVLNPGGKDVVNRPATDFPLPGTDYRRLYLNAADGTLSSVPQPAEAKISYLSTSADGQASFTIKIDQPTDLVGYFVLHVWVQSPAANDMDLFAYVQKIDGKGELIEPIVDAVRWAGQQGRLRVSHRGDVMAGASPSAYEPDHRRELPIKPSEAIPVDIPIQPLGMHWEPGQYLRVVIRGQKAVSTGNYMPASGLSPFAPLAMSRNSGRHVILTGRKHQSYLTIPQVMPVRDTH